LVLLRQVLRAVEELDEPAKKPHIMCPLKQLVSAMASFFFNIFCSAAAAPILESPGKSGKPPGFRTGVVEGGLTVPDKERLPPNGRGAGWGYRTRRGSFFIRDCERIFGVSDLC